MVTSQNFLVNELHELATGLYKGNMLVLRRRANVYECQFLSGGLVSYVVIVKDTLLATSLLQASLSGIIAGANYTSFRNTFNDFCFKIKTRSLYQELKATTTASTNQAEQRAVA